MGPSETLIQKLDCCDYCRCENMMTEEQRDRSVLELPIPEKHIHRELVEQICGKQYDGVCEMKYALERLNCNDRPAAQNVCIEMYSYDLGKRFGRPVSFDEASSYWNRTRDFEGNQIKNKAKKYGEIWDLGIRNGTMDEGGNRILRQSLSVWNIYEIIVAKPETYGVAVELQKRLQEEHKMRDRIELLVA